MRVAAVLVCACLVLAGCTANPGTDSTAPTDTASVDTTDTTTTETLTTDQQTRFDGDANADVSVYNPTNGPWTTTFTIERNGTVVLNGTKQVGSGGMWTVTTVERPGNYTFTVATEEWRDSVDIRLPRAVGDRKTYVEVAGERGGFHLRVRWEQ